MERLSWVRPFDTIKAGTLEEGNMSWFVNGQINACYQCCDRHDPEKIAITWEGNEVRRASPEYAVLLSRVALNRAVCVPMSTADRHPSDHLRRNGELPSPLLDCCRPSARERFR